MGEQDTSSVVAALKARYPVYAEATIHRWVADEAERYAGAKIRTFVPILVMRSVEATLRQLARTDGVTPDVLSLDRSERPRPAGIT